MTRRDPAHPHPHPHPDEEKREDEEKASSGKPDAARPDYSPLFERFWSAYPPNRGGRKPGKLRAWRVWEKIPAAEHAAVVEAAGNYGASEGPRGYVKHPERFLRDEFWRDWTGTAHPTPRALMRPQNVEAFREFIGGDHGAES